jgi:hypothetical protein
MKTASYCWWLLPMVALASCAAPREQPLDPDNRNFTIATTRHPFRGVRPLISVVQGKRTFPALADTGATRSLVAISDPAHRAAAGITGTEWIGAQGDPLEGVPVTLWINGTSHPAFAIAESKAAWARQFPMLLGLDVLRAHHAVFDYADGATQWGYPPPSRQPPSYALALFVLPSPRKDEWIILDTGAVNSYDLDTKRPLSWELPAKDCANPRLRLVDSLEVSRDILSGDKRVGIIGMKDQRKYFKTFAASGGVLKTTSCPTVQF